MKKEIETWSVFQKLREVKRTDGNDFAINYKQMQTCDVLLRETVTLQRTKTSTLHKRVLYSLLKPLTEDPRVGQVCTYLPALSASLIFSPV